MPSIDSVELLESELKKKIKIVRICFILTEFKPLF